VTEIKIRRGDGWFKEVNGGTSRGRAVGEPESPWSVIGERARKPRVTRDGIVRTRNFRFRALKSALTGL